MFGAVCHFSAASDSHTQVIQTLYIFSLHQLATHTHKFYKHCISSAFISYWRTHTSYTNTVHHQSSSASDTHTQVLQTLYIISLHQLVTHTHTSSTNTVCHQPTSASDTHTQVIQTLYIISLHKLVTHTHKFYKHCMSSLALWTNFGENDKRCEFSDRDCVVLTILISISTESWPL